MAVASGGHARQGHIQALVETVADSLVQHDAPIFVAEDYVIPFLTRVQRSAKLAQESLAESFSCTISGPGLTYDLLKRYPLHLTSFGDRSIHPHDQ